MLISLELRGLNLQNTLTLPPPTSFKVVGALNRLVDDGAGEGFGTGDYSIYDSYVGLV